ncbi:MAG TPA: glycosyltransferase, partial [Planctomycetota bacterium]|nr:glycosyltransferase [Planctomycetota bacterium]
MKVTYHHRTLGDGAEGVHIAEIVRALRRLGHEVDVVALVGEPAPDAAPVTANPRAAWIDALRRRVPRALFELAEMGYGLAAGARLLARTRRARPDFIYERYGLANLAGALASRALGVPLLLEVNAPIALERAEHEGGVSFPRALARLERAAFAAADRCLVVSTPLARHLE